MDQLDSRKAAECIHDWCKRTTAHEGIQEIEQKLRAWRTAGREEVIRFISELYPKEKDEGVFSQLAHMARGCRDNILAAVRKRFPYVMSTEGTPKPNPPCEAAQRAAKRFVANHFHSLTYEGELAAIIQEEFNRLDKGKFQRDARVVYKDNMATVLYRDSTDRATILIDGHECSDSVPVSELKEVQGGV